MKRKDLNTVINRKENNAHYLAQAAEIFLEEFSKNFGEQLAWQREHLEKAVKEFKSSHDDYIETIVENSKAVKGE